MLIGEGPGRKEDESGRPFVGRAGAILSGLLRDIGLSREEVFITSVVKCRPPGNRAPKREEIASCIPYLDQQIALLSPLILVPMGRIAVSAIFGRYGIPFPSFKEVRGRRYPVRDREGGPEMVILPVYHPAVITHNPPARSALEEDFRRLAECLDGLQGKDR
jgi:DNA polymerase